MTWSNKILLEGKHTLLWLTCEFPYERRAFYLLQGEKKALCQLADSVSSETDLNEYGEIVISDWGNFSNRHLEFLNTRYDKETITAILDMLDNASDVL